MRGVAKLAIGLGLALAVAGCDPVTDRKYVREGIGVDLNSSHLPEATDRLEEYTNYICQQAGYASTGSKGRFSSCFANGGWTAFVQAGMNDIDQRCDAYLSWLDAKRRDREPVLRQLATTSAVVHSIMTVSGAGTDSLDIVSNAFGLAAAGYSNWNSRLLLEVNQSTVQTLVYGRQTQFRDSIKKEVVTDRPRAIYLLRNYVRICLPITIETDINTAITLVQRGDPVDAKMTPVVMTSGAARLDLDMTKPVTPTPRPPVTILNPTIDTVEEILPFLTGRSFQRALCVKAPNGDFGTVGSETRTNIRDFKAGLRKMQSSDQEGVIKNAADRADLMKATSMFPSCAAAGFVTAYEVGAFTRHTPKGIRQMLIDGLKPVAADTTAAAADKIKSEELIKKLEAPTQPRAR